MHRPRGALIQHLIIVMGYAYDSIQMMLANALQGRLPAHADNWHLKKLKPWQAADAMSLGHKHKRNASSISDPFKKVAQ